MAIIQKEIVSLGAALQRKVRIPIYQRPYKWSTDQAMQLLDDVIHHQGQGKQNYRIGTMVFHQTSKREGKGVAVDIVDGQQRLATMVMIGGLKTLRTLLSTKERWWPCWPLSIRQSRHIPGN